MRSSDHFSRGIAKAFARRAKTQQQATQIGEKVDGVANTTTTQLDYNEQYRTTVIQKMIAHIKQQKESV